MNNVCSWRIKLLIRQDVRLRQKANKKALSSILKPKVQNDVRILQGRSAVNINCDAVFTNSDHTNSSGYAITDGYAITLVQEKLELKGARPYNQQQRPSNSCHLGVGHFLANHKQFDQCSIKSHLLFCVSLLFLA